MNPLFIFIEEYPKSKCSYLISYNKHHRILLSNFGFGAKAKIFHPNKHQKLHEFNGINHLPAT